MRRLCSSRASLTSICCRNARSTATQIVFEKGYATIGPSTTIGTQIASVSVIALYVNGAQVGTQIASVSGIGMSGIVSTRIVMNTTANSPPTRTRLIANAPAK